MSSGESSGSGVGFNNNVVVMIMVFLKIGNLTPTKL